MSLKVKVFILFFIIPTSIAGLLGLWFFDISQKALEKELFETRALALSQSSKGISGYLNTYDKLMDSIAVNNKILSRLKSDARDFSAKELKLARIELIQQWESTNMTHPVNIYVLGVNGIALSTSAEAHFTYNTVKAEPWFAEALAAKGKIITAAPFNNPDNQGIFQHYFIKARMIKDLLSDEILGLVIFEISEVKLSETFNGIMGKLASLHIVGTDDLILSSINKDEIGQSYREAYPQLSDLNQDRPYRLVRDKTKKYLISKAPISGTHFYFLERIPLDTVLAPVEYLRLLSLLLLLVLLGLILMADIIFTRWMTKPILEMEQAMGKVTAGDLSVRVKTTRTDELGRLGSVFNDMVLQIDSLIQSIREKERLRRKAELDFLQMQINPHFMYNTLSSIRFLVSMHKTDEAEKMLVNFGKMLRYNMSKAEKMVTLREELAQIDSYVEILNMRYPKRFSVEKRIAPEAYGALIPSFIIQPIIENAVYHNLTADHAFCRVRIKATNQNGLLHIKVLDNGKGIPQDKIELIRSGSIQPSDSLGLQNVDNRLRLYYGDASKLEIRSKVGMGTLIEYIIHLTGGEVHEDTDRR